MTTFFDPHADWAREDRQVRLVTIDPPVSDIVAERINRRRKELGWSRERLAEECARLGMPTLTASSLTNIESGRRQDGIRRRHVTVDELVVLTWALRASLSMLLPYRQNRIKDASDEVLVQWLEDSEGQDPWRTALLTEAANRWYAQVTT